MIFFWQCAWLVMNVKICLVLEYINEPSLALSYLTLVCFLPWHEKGLVKNSKLTKPCKSTSMFGHVAPSSLRLNDPLYLKSRVWTSCSSFDKHNWFKAVKLSKVFLSKSFPLVSFGSYHGKGSPDSTDSSCNLYLELLYPSKMELRFQNIVLTKLLLYEFLLNCVTS